MTADPSGTEEPSPYERTLAELEARTGELMKAGWQVATVPAAHVTAEPPDAGDSDRFGYVYVAPGSAEEPFREAFEAGTFDAFELFRRTVGGTEFLLTELTDPEGEVAILLAGGVGNGDREAVRRAAEAEGAMYTHVQLLDYTHLGSFRHDPGPFFDAGNGRGNGGRDDG
ncbi:hypothetical protein BRC93_05735 [Halobacteriales archaeon QS_5_70_15]|nr:MAG: hypothetical protein BRC93_05735 [Halobacteriales archaeon QS_5_70_15]